MQLCSSCDKPFIEGERIVTKCLASYHKFVDGMHAVDIIEELDIKHEGCAEEDE